MTNSSRAPKRMTKPRAAEPPPLRISRWAAEAVTLCLYPCRRRLTKRLMSAPADRDPRPVAALFRTPVFNPTERFIQDQAAALTRWRPLVVGLERKGEVLPGLREGMILPAGTAERLLFSARGRGGGIEARLRAAGPRLIHAHFGTDGLKVLPLARALGAAADHPFARL